MAAIRGEYKMVKVLLESGEDVDQRDQVLVFSSLLCCEISPFGAFPLLICIRVESMTSPIVITYGKNTFLHTN